MRKSLHSLSRRTDSNGRGQVMIEFALVLPIIVLLFLGAMDLARAVYAYGVVSDAARDGARWASVSMTNDPTNSTVISDKAKANTTMLDKTRITVGIACDPPTPPNPYKPKDPIPPPYENCYTWNWVRVTVTYEFQPITLFFIPFKLSSQSTMTIE